MFYGYSEIDSTNEEAKRFLAQLVIEKALDRLAAGAVFVARAQTDGRGQYGRQWESQLGGLYYTLLIPYPNFSTTETHHTIYGVGNEVALWLGIHTGMSVKMIHPNDLYVRGQKLGGILIEINQHAGFPVAVVGIGLNINQPTFSEEIGLRATSCLIQTGKKWPLNPLIAKLTSVLVPKFRESTWDTTPPSS